MNLIEEITKATLKSAREKAAEIGISQGAVAITCWPECEGAQKEAGSIFGESVSHTFSLIDGGDTIYRAEGRKEGDCAGVAAMKIVSARGAFTHFNETAAYFPESIAEYTSSSLPEELEGNGRTRWKGGIYFPLINVGYLGCHCGRRRIGDYAYIGIGFSGGTQDEDERVILKAIIPAIREAIKKSYNVSLPIPFYSYDKAQ